MEGVEVLLCEGLAVELVDVVRDLIYWTNPLLRAIYHLPPVASETMQVNYQEEHHFKNSETRFHVVCGFEELNNFA